MVKQWPLKRESLIQAHQLVREQFQQGHLKLSTSPWNTPIFVIKKKSGKYRLLHDLRAVNEQMEAMGALQPGLPNPAMLPQHWPLLIIDLKDCFFTIALHPQDTKRFAFTLPAINRGEPDKRYEWTVLPQGMKNSPTLCQLYVDVALQPLRIKWPDTIIYHYMDDILFAQEAAFTNVQMQEIQATLARASLVIAQEKIQQSTPWKYLGWSITNQIVRPQKLQLATKITNLNEAQRLLGDLQWLKPIVGIPNSLLDCLRSLLKGTDPTAPVTVTPQQKDALEGIIRCVEEGFVSRRDISLPIDLTIWSTPDHLLGALTQLQKKTGETRVLEWMTPPLQARKTISTKIEQVATLIRKGRIRIMEITGISPTVIYLPMKKEDLDWYLLNSGDLQTALLEAGAVVHTGPLTPRHLQWLENWDWVSKPIRSEQPIAGAITAFTDAGKKTRRAAITWKEDPRWKKQIIDAAPEDSLQTLELLAVVWALSELQGPLNVVTDSFYVAGVAQRIEDASVKEVQNRRLYELLLQLKRAVGARTKPYCIIHIRSHKWDVGLGEGNARADRLVMNVADDRGIEARESHTQFHQNAKGLVREFKIGIQEAKAIVRACPICSHHNSGIGLGCGVNPRGLKSNEIWQMDVTHVAEFGRLKNTLGPC
ncbi:PREDICTED: endogenous retrovirus group K member 113 Pol protein-like [Sturnus vulgaris]|uniref:endogenous retrovirus group K member 113 Pol protein-like n=1 Tax=Sturnus vulgaris TaxID=9172 RepID=UPI00071A8EDF|nr:PREDICTED: endogenous retrovirus group K member 113 Pol protein-like [Sturnus vulgaris]